MFSLPPGWTEERLRTITEDDLRQIPEERIRQIDLNLIPFDNVRARTIISFAKLFEEQRLSRERKGMPPAPPKDIFKIPDDAVVQVVEENGFDDFGFITFRTDYSDDESWDKWDAEYDRLIDLSIERSAGGQKIMDKCLMPRFEDPELHGATHQQIQQSYYRYIETEGLAPGLDMGLCLVADTAAVESMNNDLPWVYALDINFDHSSEVEEGEYPGYFRVAVVSVIPELYPMLTAMPPAELWSQGDEIWQSIV
ncbi:hypothetical protein BO79DRAFT_231492 [Aspergillus costaricaensis CBS 115574]|uniref:Uncharacterized protein n=1 Tax=Aspergillus costaricaensis CBS 115574 TaxID=1448317 RepID=A0ACD1I501_9EURO|nr:hypothetical protein BO79DRAFT_231492 [Aspergillus costaricaensis CBS 115574]RAK85565.1 hypothetical protein BO79DRAFT_231492 [Aspergillus costaricaensis CBS 115574]